MRWGFAVSVLTLGMCCGGVNANDSRGALTLAFENDLFGAGTDQHYSHGTEITYVSDAYSPKFLQRLAEGIGMFDGGDELRFVWSLGQQMYTPADISRRDLIVDDRPYAGWLYTSIGMFTDSPAGGNGWRSIQRLEAILGQVGPDSRAENVQRAIHKVTDSEQPQGWDNQLHNETTFDVQYQREWIVPLTSNVDVVPRVRTMLGTSQRNVGAGFTFRVGSGLNADSGPPLIRPAATGSHYFRPTQPLYWYVFAGAHGRYVAYNIFVDGNRDGDSHSVDREDWVGELQAGAVIGWDAWRITLTEIYRSSEFDGQDDPDEFGSIAVSYRF